MRLCRRPFFGCLRSPYWWWVSVTQCINKGPSSLLVGDYVQFRQGLEDATVSGGRLTSAATSNLGKPGQAFERLYGVLTILDSKASALMRLNSVMLAAAAFLVNPQSQTYQISQRVLWAAVLSSLSIALCLVVVSVDWPFLGLVRQTEEEFDFTDEMTNLQRVSLFRQCVYRIAWWISFIAIWLFVSVFMGRLF